MHGWTQRLYGALPAEEQQLHAWAPHDAAQNYATVDNMKANCHVPNQLQPQRVENSCLKTTLRLLFDLFVAAIALLFAVFGVWVYIFDGSPADPGSTGLKLFEASQYAPTIFPVLFAAIVGGSIKSIASWRIQTSHGATVGLVEQCLGSQTMTRGFITQIRLRALNLLGILIISLWSLSPLGSQASLRVISIVPNFLSNLTHLAALNTSSEYQFSRADGRVQAVTVVANPTVASIVAAMLLGRRNQDLWGNVRLPAIEQLENSGGTGWMNVSETNNLTYPSLVGTPIGMLPSSGNTSFTLPGSYLSIACPVFGPSDQTKFTNYTVSGALSPDNGYDCSWTSSEGGDQYQIAISTPCSGNNASDFSGTRNARRLVWESFSDDKNLNRAECELTTTFVDVNVTCTGSSSGSSTGSTCNPSVVRRSVTPLFDGNWTVLDLDDQLSGKVNAGSVIELLTGLFPHAQVYGGQQPVITYLTNPNHAAVGGFTSVGDASNTLDASTFEIRLAQLLNTILYIGIRPEGFTGSFNTSQTEGAINLTATTTVQQDVVSCNRVWLGVLIFASLAAFFFALIGAVLRFVTLAPDVLGSISVALLHNKIEGMPGSSTWSSSTWARNLKNTRLHLGDVEPEAKVGRIALVTSAQRGLVSSITVGRCYV